MRDLVLVPGLGSDGAVWARTVAALGDDARCAVGDTFANDTLAGMARTILTTAPKRFALAGVSMGGMVALEMVRAAPERITHLALVDTTVDPDALRRKAYRLLASLVVGMSRNYRRLAERSLGSLVHASAPRDVRHEIVAMSVRVGARRYVRQNTAVLMRGDPAPRPAQRDRPHGRDRGRGGRDDAGRAVTDHPRARARLDDARHPRLRAPAAHRGAAGDG